MAFGMAFMSVSMASFAVTDTNKTIASIGTQDSMAYVSFKEALSVGCKFNNIYIMDLTKPESRAKYATLLTAKTIDNKVARIDYTISEGGTCTASLIQVNSP
jgi:hypothetical protein